MAALASGLLVAAGACSADDGAARAPVVAAPTAAAPSPTPSPTPLNDAEGNPIVPPAPATVPGVDLVGAVRGTEDFLYAYFNGARRRDTADLRAMSEP